MAEAGWYQDPHQPQQMRYWDGSTWTEHIHVPEAPPTPPFGSPPPAPPVASYQANTINDIGDWLQRSFKVALRKLGACLALTLIGILPWLVVVGLFVLALRGLWIEDGATGLGGGGAALLVLAGLAAIGALLWAGVVQIAQVRVLYDAHRGRDIGVGQALDVGRRNLWRLVTAYLILLAIGLAVLIPFGAVFGLLVASGDTPAETVETLAPALNLVNAIFFPLSLWLQVKFAFIPVAAAVSPRDNGLISTSMQLSSGRFWAVLGRIFLLSIVVAIAMIPVQILMVIGIAVSAVVLADGGGAAVGVVVLVAIVVIAFLALAFYLAQIFQMSGQAGLYADLGGPESADEALVAG